MRYTIADVKRLSAVQSPHYFTRSSLKFFGQTMRDFRVRHVAGRVFIFAPCYKRGSLMGYSFREFVPATGALELPRFANGNLVPSNTIGQIEQYLAGRCARCGAKAPGGPLACPACTAEKSARGI